MGQSSNKREKERERDEKKTVNVPGAPYTGERDVKEIVPRGGKKK